MLVTETVSSANTQLTGTIAPYAEDDVSANMGPLSTVLESATTAVVGTVPVYVTSFAVVSADLVPVDQIWFYHPDMQTRVSEAEDDVAAGRTTTVRSAEEAQAHLDSLKAPS